MPYMSPSGMHWRCSIGSVDSFYRNHGAILCESAASFLDESQPQTAAAIARYSSAQGNHYFDWNDSEQDDARSLADKFVNRLQRLADRGKGWDYPYAGWYLHMLGLAEGGWLPVVLADYVDVKFDSVPLNDVRPREWTGEEDGETPVLSMPPPGELQQDYRP